jgi:glycosyltransferase involved in cell wall biosynthesis
MNKLSVVIITKNSEKYIADAILSAQFADEVVILDNYSTDNTTTIAKELGAKVYESEWLGFGKQKNKAISLAQHNWVFVLDSDERITKELQDEMLTTLQNPTFNGYKVARLNNFFGKNIKYCGLYPDYSIRLFDKTKGKFNDVAVHESVQITNPGKLQNHMLHLAYTNVEEFTNKQRKYAKLSTKKPNKIKAIFSPIWTFLKFYILRLGFLEGWRGFVIAKIYAQYTFWKYTKS